MEKFYYLFGDGEAEGSAEMKNLLGGKGANLAEMNLIGVPVPPGFTLTTDLSTRYMRDGRDAVKDLIWDDIKVAIAHVESKSGSVFGDVDNPCLVSVRSGARASMPGMMDTILNLGLNDKAVLGIAKKTGNDRFAWDSYRRFIHMYGDVVMGMKAENKEDISPFEEILEQQKEERGVELDSELSADDLKVIVGKFKDAVKRNTGVEFPNDPWDQLWGAICAVFDSWTNERAVLYRKLEGIPVEWGTAVNVQAMVYGNMGSSSATGVAFTRDAATGERIFNGEYLIDAQGEDVVAGVRTPQQITVEGSRRWAKLQKIEELDRADNYPSLEETMPEVYAELFEIQNKLEDHYKDMQDLEFTIQEGKLWLLQTRNGKRTAKAMVKIAMDFLDDGLISEKELLKRQDANKLTELLLPIFDPKAIKLAEVLTAGLPASPGAATGRIVFFADEADRYIDSILVRTETSPEDLEGMNIANGILTARGGMTSHAAVVARGMGKCCVSGASDIKIDYYNREMQIGDRIFKEGDYLSLNGTTGEVYSGTVKTVDSNLDGDFARLMNISDKYSKLKVRTNADTPKDATKARGFGAKGIGLCRTEHMFFEGDRIKTIRKMILAKSELGRRDALAGLLPYQREDFKGIFRAMEGYGVTIRFLDPPLHEFVPHESSQQRELAKELGLTYEEVRDRVHSLEEVNPMLGHRGCRLGNTYPEITEMQTRAVIEAAVELHKEGVEVAPEIMIPLVGGSVEFLVQKSIVKSTAEKVFEESGCVVDYQIGTMIEVPRAALMASSIAENADFFSFGTNDLTQMTYGFSRDDAGKFLGIYQDKGILTSDPFQILDQEGVGQLVEIAVERGRSVKSDIKLGICGEHGGEPSSVKYCHSIGLDYVSCSPFRVPVARLAAAQAAIE